MSLLPEPGEEVSITISIGMTAYNPPEELTDFIQRADKALYGSKEGGRDKVSVLLAQARIEPDNS